MRSRNRSEAIKALDRGEGFVLYEGDCVALLKATDFPAADLFLSSPPYFIGKEYDRSGGAAQFLSDQRQIAKLIEKNIRPGGSICWQVGNHVQRNQVTPLDFLTYSAFSEIDAFTLRNRLVWTFDHGTHARRRFSGRHETILWFSNGDDYTFNLDDVRVPQKYPGKRHYKGPRKGEFSGNPLGKNPGDVWTIPNVKSKHVEKTAHPCQFPLELARRLIRATTNPGDLVCDPYSGSGTTGIAALLEGRRFIGAETKASYCTITMKRLEQHRRGTLRFREMNQPIAEPNERQAVARRPDHFRTPDSEAA